MSDRSPDPLMMFCLKGRLHLCFAAWALRSLLRFGSLPIEVMVSSEDERAWLLERFPEISCKVVSPDPGNYPSFSYKPFALAEYLKLYDLPRGYDEIVICDADTVWLQDPRPLFDRFSGSFWFHKITAVDPADYDIPLAEVPEGNIGLRTINNYRSIHPVSALPGFIVNAGLFMLPTDQLEPTLQNWMAKIVALPSEAMLMSEALLALTLAEMGIAPTSDRADVKHFGRPRQSGSVGAADFFAVETPSGFHTGYQTVRHYYGDQRPRLIEQARGLNLDPDNLAETVLAEMNRTSRKSRLGLVRRLAGRLFN